MSRLDLFHHIERARLDVPRPGDNGLHDFGGEVRLVLRALDEG
jgi:hypothetical protein